MSEEKLNLTFEEVKEKFKDTDKIILCMGDKIVDVTDYKLDHPGGPDILKDNHLCDPNDTRGMFDQIFHSEKAIKKMESLVIGTITDYVPTKSDSREGSNQSTQFMIAILTGLAVFIAYYFVL